MSSTVRPDYPVARSVRHVDIEGLRYILDTRTESYSVLDDVASAMWSVLVGERSSAAGFEQISADYDIDQDRWTAELAAFGEECLRQGLLTRGDPERPAVTDRSVPASGSNSPAMIAAMVCLLATRRSLKQDGFRITYDSYAGIAVHAEGKALAASLRAFTWAENLYVAGRAPGDCLLRSLSLYRFLRSRGCAAEHVIGVRRFPFKAHAWVECDGAAMLDGRAREFTPISRLGAAPAATS
jgi:hypothetical protein